MLSPTQGAPKSMGQYDIDGQHTYIGRASQSVKIDLNKKLDPKQKTIQTFNIDVKRFRKTKNENLLI